MIVNWFMIVDAELVTINTDGERWWLLRVNHRCYIQHFTIITWGHLNKHIMIWCLIHVCSFSHSWCCRLPMMGKREPQLPAGNANEQPTTAGWSAPVGRTWCHGRCALGIGERFIRDDTSRWLIFNTWDFGWGNQTETPSSISGNCPERPESSTASWTVKSSILFRARKMVRVCDLQVFPGSSALL